MSSRKCNRCHEFEAQSTIIPAQPGWYVMTVILTDSRELERVEKTSILAWMVESDTFTRAVPITVSGVPRDESVICDPNGQFEHRHEGILEDEEDAVQLLIDEVRAEREVRVGSLLDAGDAEEEDDDLP